mgnify:CR=1 FL=1
MSKQLQDAYIVSATRTPIGKAPRGIAAAAGTLYIADRVHHQVRRVDAGGTIGAFAGTGHGGSGGVL